MQFYDNNAILKPLYVNKNITTFPNTSRGSLEFMSTGLTLSPGRRPLTGNRLSKIPSNFPFSSGWNKTKSVFQGLNITVFMETVCPKVLSLLTRIAHCGSVDVDNADELLPNGLPVSFCKTVIIDGVKAYPIED